MTPLPDALRSIGPGVVAAACLAAALSPAEGNVAQHDHRPPAASRGEFAVRTSCKPELGRMIDRGVALLHAGALDAAVEMFRLVNHADVDCVFSWWGAAMAHWSAAREREDPSSLDRGRAAIASARVAVGGTPRERRYVDAVALLYGAATPADRPESLRAYERAMERLSADFPDDVNATLVAALALADRPEASEEATVANRLAAVAALRRVAASVNHAAVTHALLVAGAHPAVVPRIAADAVAVLKQSEPPPELLAAAAQVFATAGNWSRVVEAGLRRADDARRRGALQDEVQAMDETVYGLLQQGRDREAADRASRLEAIWAATGPPRPRSFAGVPTLRARMALEQGDWGARLVSPAVEATAAATGYVVAAADVLAARGGGGAATPRVGDVVPNGLEGPASLGMATGTLQSAAAAWQLARRGRPAAGAALLQQAVAREDLNPGEGPAVLPAPPARELLGEFQLAFGRPEDALASFVSVLEARPGRLRALHGAALAAKAAGDASRSSEFYRQLRGNTEEADDPPRKEIREARTSAMAK